MKLKENTIQKSEGTQGGSTFIEEQTGASELNRSSSSWTGKEIEGDMPFEIIPMKNSPITIVGLGEEYHVVMFGNVRLNPEPMSKEDAIKDAERTDLERLCIIMSIMVDKYDKLKLRENE